MRLLPLIKLEKISRRYALQSHRVQALDEVTLEIHAGERLAIVGASGSGKSTLMHILGLLDHHYEGSYFLKEKKVSALSEDERAIMRNKEIGFVFQSFFLLQNRSALQNVMLPLFYAETDRCVAKERAMHLLDKMGMADFASHQPNQLSGGQQQRVAIARALVNDPTLILADEPTGALDSHTGEEVMQLLMDLHQKENRTVVIITHDLAISRRCERVVTMKDGRQVRT
ncbi:MAG TPA: ABC transporter ATP-binding protein [Gammaproteobacteria bacterium]|jgi:putative ABC transport system ATP-binding protein|nr:ABC transporter ATP-binding protein [Gammaproteobacteria bacterium]